MYGKGIIFTCIFLIKVPLFEYIRLLFILIFFVYSVIILLCLFFEYLLFLPLFGRWASSRASSIGGTTAGPG